MKTLKKIMMAMFVMACIGMTASCGKDDDGGSNDNSYSSMLVGTWQINSATSNGTDIMPYVGNIQFTFNTNGTGILSDAGVTENNGFTWVINGDVITINTTHGGVHMEFTINSMTSTECTFSGAAMELDGHMLENVVIHMVKVNGGGGDDPNPNPNPDPITGSLEGTSWVSNYSGTMTEQGMQIDYTLNLRLTFTTATAGTLVETMTAMGYTQTENQDFTYTYNENTHTGVMTHTYYDEDLEEDVSEDLPFSYNPSDNTITITNPNPGENPEGFPSSFVFTRVSK